MSPKASEAALILIDIQFGFDNEDYWGRRNNPQAEARAAELLQLWRDRGAPRFFVRHDSINPNSPLRPGQPGNAIKPMVAPQPGERVIGKSVHSAFIGTDLELQLRRAGIERVVVCGIATDHCVSTTARMASDLGFLVTVVDDACATFDQVAPDGTLLPAEAVHAANLASIIREFGDVCSTASLLETSPHEQRASYA